MLNIKKVKEMLRIFNENKCSIIFDFVIIVTIFIASSFIFSFMKEKCDRYDIAFFSFIALCFIITISFIVAKEIDK